MNHKSSKSEATYIIFVLINAIPLSVLLLTLALEKLHQLSGGEWTIGMMRGIFVFPATAVLVILLGFIAIILGLISLKPLLMFISLQQCILFYTIYSIGTKYFYLLLDAELWVISQYILLLATSLIGMSIYRSKTKYLTNHSSSPTKKRGLGLGKKRRAP